MIIWTSGSCCKLVSIIIPSVNVENINSDKMKSYFAVYEGLVLETIPCVGVDVEMGTS